MSRDYAIEALREPLFDEIEIRREIDFFCRKIGMSLEEFDRIMGDEPRSHKDYASWDRYVDFLKPFKNALLRLRS
jgi:hypothetical protein